MGDSLKKRLQDLMNIYVPIGDVRGSGLMLGVELVKDRGSKEPDSEMAAGVAEWRKIKG